MPNMVTLALLSAVTLSGCAPAVLVYHETRKVAKERVTVYLDGQDPAHDHAVRAECVIKAMSYGEIVKLANDDPAYAKADDDALIAKAAARPAVATCEADAAAKAQATAVAKTPKVP